MAERYPQLAKAARNVRTTLGELPGEVRHYFGNERFAPLTPPLTASQMTDRETNMMDVTNWRDDHSVPSEGKHYRYMWNWDSAKAVVINARRGRPDKAEMELLKVEEFREKETGFLPCKVIASEASTTFRDYPELWTFNRPDKGSSYTQPPLQAWAALETYKSFVEQGQEAEGLAFLEKMYGTAEEGNYTGLKGTFAYFRNHRQNSPDDPLIFNVHPMETGRDYTAEMLAVKTKPLRGNSDKIAYGRTASRWVRQQIWNHKHGKVGRDAERTDWIPEKIREKYAVNDVMFNVIYTNGLRQFAEIGEILAANTTDNIKKAQYEQDITTHRDLADGVEKQILEKMWNPDDKFFYNLDKDGTQITVKSISGLYPLLLDNINSYHTGELLKKLESPDWFNTPYPIPTHPVCSDYYDPHYRRREGPNWQGPVWLDMNHLIVEEGIVKQVNRRSEHGDNYNPTLARRAILVAENIAQKTKDLLAINDKVWEFYDPETGKGMRVPSFMWSNLGLHFENFDKAKAAFDAAQSN